MSINISDKIRLIDAYAEKLSYTFSQPVFNIQRIGELKRDIFEKTKAPQGEVPKPALDEEENAIGQIEFKQRIGDCYLLSVIYALSRNKDGQKVLENLIKFDEEGDYVVKFHNYDEVKVSEKELEENTFSEGDRIVQLLEYAFGKARNEKLYQNNLSIEDALSDGWQSVTINDICGWKADEITPLPDVKNRVFSHYFDKLAPDRSRVIILAETNDSANYKQTVNGEEYYFCDEDLKFPASHSFIITDIDSENKMVSVVDPHDTKEKKYTISYDRFSDIFSALIISAPSREISNSKKK